MSIVVKQQQKERSNYPGQFITGGNKLALTVTPYWDQNYKPD